jgi:biopolymer transport protein ExbD
MRRSFLKKRKQQAEDMPLQITSMADIFTVVLIFLLKSYATGAIEIAPSAGIQLPDAQGNLKSVQALKLEVSDSGVMIDGRAVSKMSAFKLPESDISVEGASRSLMLALEQERAREVKAAGPGSTPIKADPRIIVIADQRAPYATIKAVLASAATQGYTEVKLAVAHDQ